MRADGHSGQAHQPPGLVPVPQLLPLCLILHLFSLTLSVP